MVNEYDPQHFSSTFEITVGSQLWSFLNEQKIVALMIDASDAGRPAVERIQDQLIQEFGNSVRENRIKQMIGHMVKQVLEPRGYVEARNGVRIDGRLFLEGTTYRRR
jgi:hypothetical protein